MIRRPPRSTRTDTLFPYTTLFRSKPRAAWRSLPWACSTRAECPRGTALRDALEQGQIRDGSRSEEHTSELQSLMRISYAVFCLKKKKRRTKKRQQIAQ